MTGNCIMLNGLKVLKCKCGGYIRQGKLDMDKHFCCLCNEYYGKRRLLRMVSEQGTKKDVKEWARIWQMKNV